MQSGSPTAYDCILAARALLAATEPGFNPDPAAVLAALRDWPPLLESMRLDAFDLRLEDHEVERRALSALITRWKKAHPPIDLAEERCAGCGEAIITSGTSWRVLGDGAWTHYGGEYALRCWRAWCAKRDAEALVGLLRMAAGEAS